MGEELHEALEWGYDIVGALKWQSDRVWRARGNSSTVSHTLGLFIFFYFSLLSAIKDTFFWNSCQNCLSLGPNISPMNKFYNISKPTFLMLVDGLDKKMK